MEEAKFFVGMLVFLLITGKFLYLGTSAARKEDKLTRAESVISSDRRTQEKYDLSNKNARLYRIIATMVVGIVTLIVMLCL